jgi:hypothetical protein
MTKLYRASSDFIGDASLNVEQRSMLKVKTVFGGGKLFGEEARKGV